MMVCDRCKNPEAKAVLLLRDSKDGTQYDLCQECKEEFEKFLTPIEPRKPGRPRKDGTN